MPSKLGFQLHDGEDVASPGALEWLHSLRPVALLVQHSVELMNAAYAAVGAGPVYVFQRYEMGDVQDYVQAHPSITDAVEAFLEELEPTLAKLRWTYHCSVQIGEITPEAAEFEALAVRLAQQRYNVRLCIGNFASGTPDPEDWDTYRPALEAAAKYGAIVGMQEEYPILPYVGYAPNANIPDAESETPRRLVNELPYPQGVTQPGQFVGRYRHLRDYCREHNIPVRILMTRIGAGRVLPDWMDSFSPGIGYWRSLAAVWGRMGFNNPQTHYLQDVMWMDQHVYTQDPEVIGICFYAWNTEDTPNAEIGDASTLINGLYRYMERATRDQPPPYLMYPLSDEAQYRVIVTRLRIREIPSLNTQFVGGFDYGEVFTATHYTFSDGMLWLKHQYGWSAYAPLQNGNPDYNNKFLEGKLITTPRQDSAVNNFVGTIEEVRRFLQSHKGRLFYIEINSESPPDGARRFRISTFPVEGGRRIINQLHPSPGDPLMTPGAKQQLRNHGEL